ncbi:MAG: hypothetical protein D6719_07540 [Candidatus Dadabacteria bacterium]|nr:MAG: hypothetical protein D6719_07540 [Candidatus Dadabacteria bacterium]
MKDHFTLTTGVMFRTPLIMVLIMAFSGCYITADADKVQHRSPFVSKKEVLGVTLAREGLHYYSKGRYVDAELKFRQALYLFPEADNIRLNLAVVLDRVGQYQESISNYQKLLGHDPDELIFWAGLAHVYVSSGDYNRALKIYRQSLIKALDDKDFKRAASFSESLAALNFKLGFEEEARCYSELAYVLDSGQLQLENYLKLLVATNQITRSKSLLAALEPRQRSPFVMEQFAILEYLDGNYQRAASMIANALENNHNPGLNLELELIKELIHNRLPDLPASDEQFVDSQSAEPVVESESDKLEQIEEEKRKRIERISNFLSGATVLYWPEEILTELKEIISQENEA